MTTASYAAWPYRATVRFPGYTDAETLRDFPALVRLGTNLAGFSYSQCGGSWASLRFADEAGTTPLAYEVDVWNTNGESAVWVRVPALTNGTAIRAYWGVTGMTNPSPLLERGAVWREDDEAVWHWQDDLRDATWRGREAVNDGATAAPGVVGTGRAFDGVDDALALAVPAAWYGSNAAALTVSLWVKPAAAPVQGATVFGTASSNTPLYVMLNTVPVVRKWSVAVGGLFANGPGYDLGAWQMLGLVLSNGTVYVQKNDGALAPLGTYAGFASTIAPELGWRAGAGYYFAGGVDEVRLSRTAHSAAWLRAAYRTVAPAAGFATYGPVESAAELDADGDGMPDAWERTHFGDASRDGAGDWDGDRLRDGAEYVAGTDPTNAASCFTVLVTGNGAAPVVAFRTVAPPAGANVVRLYSLEYARALSGTVWTGVSGLTNLEGAGADVYYTNALMPGASFYRARTWLTLPAAP